MGKYVFKANTKDTRIVDIKNVLTGMCSLAGKPITRSYMARNILTRQRECDVLSS